MLTVQLIQNEKTTYNVINTNTTQEYGTHYFDINPIFSIHFTLFHTLPLFEHLSPLTFLHTLTVNALSCRLTSWLHVAFVMLALVFLVPFRSVRLVVVFFSLCHMFALICPLLI